MDAAAPAEGPAHSLRLRVSVRSSSGFTAACDGDQVFELPIVRSDTAPPALETDGPEPLAERAHSRGREPTKLATHPRRWSLTCADFLCGHFSVLTRAVTITAASSLLSGYDQGVIATAMLSMKPDLALSGVEVETSIGCLNLAAAGGGILASYLADGFGRKKAIGCAYTCFFFGSLAIAAASGFWLVLVGRLVQGVGVGIALVVPPVLQAELVPAHRRGGLISVGDAACNVGILLGYASALVFYGLDQQWRYMFTLGALPALLLLCLIWSVPESPRWLVRAGEEAKALRVISAMHRLAEHDAPAEDDTAMLERASARTDAAASARAQLNLIRLEAEAEAARPTLSWRQVLWSADLVNRGMVWRGLAIAFFSQAVGSEAVVYYAPLVVQAAGVRDERATIQIVIGIGLVKVCFLMIGASLCDRIGRRPLLLTSAAGLTAALCLLAGAAATQGAPPALTIAALCLFMAAFSVGFSPLTYVLCSELFPSASRARCMACALCATRVTAGLIASSFVSMREAFTPAGAWLCFVPFAAGALVLVAVAIPETKGVPLEDMRKLFERRPAARATAADGSLFLAQSLPVLPTVAEHPPRATADAPPIAPRVG